MEKIDKHFPLFVLATIVVERVRYYEQIIPSMNRLKLKYWDHEGINLHSRDIRKSQGAFSILQNESLRKRFIAELTALMQNLPYTLFVVAINKRRHLQRYNDHAHNPYELALTFTLERILHFLEQSSETHLPVVAEARGKNEDRNLQAAFYNLMSKGTYYHNAEQFSRLSCPLLFENKRNNICGIQLADLCAYPSARHILRPGQPNRAYEVIKSHLYMQGNVTGWKIFP